MYLFTKYILAHGFHVMMNEVPETKTKKDFRSLKAEEQRWFLLLLREVFPQVLWFSPLVKNQHFQFNHEY